MNSEAAAVTFLESSMKGHRTSPDIALGLQLGTQPPLSAARVFLLAARAMRLDSVMVIDHFQNLYATAIWDNDLTWLAKRRPTPHDHFDYQAFLGYLAPHAGRLQLGVGVTDPIRRHPVVIAQALLTVAHMTRRPPILGIGAGELLNIAPYGLDYRYRTTRLEEALQVIRLCLHATGPITFEGRHFQLRNARMDLRAPKGRVPRIWVAAHGPRSLALAGRYADGWYPTMVTTPEEYAKNLKLVRDAAAAAGRNPNAVTPALHRFAVIHHHERTVRSMLDTRAIRALALIAPAEMWRAAGARHPFGDTFSGLADFVPDHYDRATMDRALAAVPMDLITNGALLYGTPEQAVRRLRAFSEAGMRHVILAPMSGLVSPRAAVEELRAAGTVRHALRTGTG